jgi:hypothetical protein
LVALEGPATGARIAIPLEGLSIGRDTTPALSRDLAVSGRHAQIRWTGDGRLLIEDVGSRNGTWVNGVVVSQPTVIGEGDRIQLGTGIYELRIEAAAPTDFSHPPSPTGQDTVEVHGGVHASSGAVAAGRDIHAGEINTGDYYEMNYDPTGLNEVSGFPRFLMVVGILLGLAGFALFAFPIFMAVIEAFGCQGFDCAPELNTETMPFGLGLFFGGMVLTVIARVLQRDDPRGRRRG